MSDASLSKSRTRSNALSVLKCIRNDGLVHNSANLIALEQIKVQFRNDKQKNKIPQTSTTKNFIGLKTSE